MAHHPSWLRGAAVQAGDCGTFTQRPEQRGASSVDPRKRLHFTGEGTGPKSPVSARAGARMPDCLESSTNCYRPSVWAVTPRPWSLGLVTRLVHSAAIPKCDQTREECGLSVPGMRGSVEGGVSPRTRQGACAAARGSDWLPRAGEAGPFAPRFLPFCFRVAASGARAGAGPGVPTRCRTPAVTGGRNQGGGLG